MRKLFGIFLFFFGLLLVFSITYAATTTMSTYYPSPSGRYTKMHLINTTGVPQTATFCGQKNNGVFINAGTIFADFATGYLEICKSDGSLASYPGSCFNRFGTSIPASPCPNNYQIVNPSGQTFAMTAGNNVISWICCFTGQAAAAAPITKSGCFSIYATGPALPALCTSASGDPNAYDVGCDIINSSDMPASVFKRNCCFNNSSGPNALTVPSNCSCANTCGTATCGTDPCGDKCGPNGGNCAVGTCSSSTPGTPGICSSCPNNTCGAATCGTDPCGDKCGPNGGNCAVGTCSSSTPGTPGICSSCPNNTCGAATCGTDPCGDKCGPNGGNCAVGVCSSSTPGNCCTPTTCATLGVNCGNPSDGCGNFLSCGSCPPVGQPTLTICSGFGPNGSGTCQACPAGSDCGSNNCGPDSCGNANGCGTCTIPQTCGGGGTPGVCGCSPSCTGPSCTVGGPDGCGGTCGSCVCSGTACNGKCCGSGQECNTGTGDCCLPTVPCGSNTCGTDSCGTVCGTGTCASGSCTGGSGIPGVCCTMASGTCDCAGDKYDLCGGCGGTCTAANGDSCATGTCVGPNPSGCATNGASCSGTCCASSYMECDASGNCCYPSYPSPCATTPDGCGAADDGCGHPCEWGACLAVNGTKYDCVIGQGCVVGKPVIYLYPSQKEIVSVRLDFKGKVDASYPIYEESTKGWKVTAYPDGHIISADGQEYSYLFWEGTTWSPTNYDFSKGFLVKGEDSAEFLKVTLAQYGLTPKEYNEFIVYWYPRMKMNKYNLVHFAGQEYEDIAQLNITPRPDSMLRIFMVFKAVKEETSIEPQKIEPFKRSGFSVVEWGGTEIQNSASAPQGHEDSSRNIE